MSLKKSDLLLREGAERAADEAQDTVRHRRQLPIHITLLEV